MALQFDLSISLRCLGRDVTCFGTAPMQLPQCSGLNMSSDGDAIFLRILCEGADFGRVSLEF